MTYPSIHLYPSSTVFPGSIVTTPNDGLGVEINGLNLTQTDGAGVLWRTFSPLVGWDGSPPSSVQTTQRVRAPGVWTSPRNLAGRTITLNGRVEAPSPDALQVALDELNAAVSLSDFVTTITRGSTTRSAITCRQDEVLISDQTDTVADWSVQLLASDPRKFTTALSATTHLPSTTGGLVVPLVVPVVVSSTTVSGTITLTNPGNATGAVSITVNGPSLGPSITHVTSGLTVAFDASLVIEAGQTLVVDMESQTALINGQVSRNAYITQRGWSGFLPGVNLWSFTSSSYDPATTFVVSATPAWQ